MAGHRDDLQRDADFGQLEAFAAGQRVRHAGDVLQRRAEHGHGPAGGEFRDAADVIAVVVGGEDGAEAVAAVREVRDHRRRIAGIDHRDMAVGAQQPDVVVVEGGQCSYLNH